MELSSAQRRALRAQAHHLQPLIIVGGAGLTPAVLREIGVHLNSHELIKVKLQDAGRDERGALALAIADGLEAAVVQHIGKTVVLFRPKPAEQASTGKRRPRRKPARRTKRSFQMPS